MARRTIDEDMKRITSDNANVNDEINDQLGWKKGEGSRKASKNITGITKKWKYG